MSEGEQLESGYGKGDVRTNVNLVARTFLKQTFYVEI